MKKKVKCVVTASAGGELSIRSLKLWARRRGWPVERAEREIRERAEVMEPPSVPAVMLADMRNRGTAIEPRWVLDLPDVSAWVIVGD